MVNKYMVGDNIVKNNVIANYINGNTHITLWSDGTREMETEDNEFKFDYPTNVDVTITHKCDNECKYCYLGCRKDGSHADLTKFNFFDTLNPGQELAINLNNCDHPQLFEFLQKMRDKGVFVNGTVNQVDFENHAMLIKALCDLNLLWGLGVSLNKPPEEFIKLIKNFPNAVIHVINGLFTADDIEMLRDKGLKILILGYKNIGRGNEFQKQNEIIIQSRQEYLKNVLPTLFERFDVISFDNLAIDQLNVKQLLSPEEWERFYQGDEGTATFAIDLVTGKFSRNSMVTDQNRLYPICDSVKEMFDVIKKEVENENEFV